MSMPPRSGRRRATQAWASRHGAAELERQAERLRRRFEEASGAKRSAPTRWRSTVPSGPAQGTYQQCRPCALHRHRAGRNASREIAARLFAVSYYSGWGMRTVAHGEARYNPMSYHNGSIWPHDNAADRRGPRALRSWSRPIEILFEAHRARRLAHVRPAHCRSSTAASAVGPVEDQRCIRPPVRPRPGPRARRSRCWPRCSDCGSILLSAPCGWSKPVVPCPGRQHRHFAIWRSAVPRSISWSAPKTACRRSKSARASQNVRLLMDVWAPPARGGAGRLAPEPRCPSLSLVGRSPRRELDEKMDPNASSNVAQLGGLT